MENRMPAARKPSEQLRRRNRPEQWVELPAAGCSIVVPKWPSGSASKSELDLWRRLWSLPVACWWHEQQIEPFVVARYVRVALETPSHAAVSRLESDLGLTPAAMLRMRLAVEHVEADRDTGEDPYRHLRAVASK